MAVSSFFENEENQQYKLSKLLRGYKADIHAYTVIHVTLGSGFPMKHSISYWLNQCVRLLYTE